MAAPALDGSGGPHVYVEDLDLLRLDPDDRHHLERALRLRVGDPLTAGDGAGRWRACRFGPDLEAEGDVCEVPPPCHEVSVAFSLLKGGRPELVVQKLTELGVDRIVPLLADRSVVRWDAAKQAANHERFRRVAREAGMQSRRARLPEVEPVTPAAHVAARTGAVLAHPGGRPLAADDHVLLVGPEGGWSPEEVAGRDLVDLGPTVLRAETAAIAAATLLTALRDGRVAPTR